jgi:hypothetical protein
VSFQPEDKPNQVTVNETTVYVDFQGGIQGAVGPQGPPGPVGPSAPTLRFVFDQAVPSSFWTINHSLGGFPSVAVVDSANTVVYGMIEYVDSTQVTVTFSAPFSGKAFLT